MMEYWRVKRMVHNSGLFADKIDFRAGWNRVRWHNCYETTEHFLSKAMISLLAMKNKKVIFTEADMRCGRVLDVLQMNKSGEFVAYEIESKKNTKPDVENVDIFEIKLSDMPVKAQEGIKELEKWLKTYLV